MLDAEQTMRASGVPMGRWYGDPVYQGFEQKADAMASDVAERVRQGASVRAPARRLPSSWSMRLYRSLRRRWDARRGSPPGSGPGG